MWGCVWEVRRVVAVAVLEVRSRMECAPSFLSSEELGCGAQPGLCYLCGILEGMGGGWSPRHFFLVGGREKQDVIKMTAIPPCQQRIAGEEKRRREEQMSLLSEDGDEEGRYLERRIIAL